MNHPTALVILHQGFEEIEAICVIDILHRAGFKVTVASKEPQLMVCGRSDLKIQADQLLDQALLATYDAFILPGGPGTPGLVADERVIQAAQHHYAQNKLLAAICAAPLALEKAGLLKGKHFTAHPCTWDVLTHVDRQATVVKDGHLITACGPAAAMEFAIAIVESLLGQSKADEIKREIGLK